MVDAIVVGGGIVGMSTAYHLVCTGVDTILIDGANLTLFVLTRNWLI